MFHICSTRSAANSAQFYEDRHQKRKDELFLVDKALCASDNLEERFEVSVMRWFLTAAVFLLAVGCFEEAKIAPPPPKVYYKPRIFSEGKLVINPYRDPKTFGPKSPYVLRYDEEKGVYRIERRKGVVAPKPPAWRHPLIYE